MSEPGKRGETESAQAPPLRVLIVEDSEDDALLLELALKQASYDTKCRRVDTRPAMLAALEEGEWDVVIADYVMPRFSGLAALSLLKERGADLPFIVVSGKIGEEAAVEAMKAGAHDFVAKGRLTRLVPAIQRELKEVADRRARRRAEEERARLERDLREANEALESRVEERTAALAKLNEELQHEISERKRAEQLREESISLISHDLRSPLSSVIGATAFLARTLGEKGMRTEARYAESALKSAKRMNLMIQELVDSAWLESGHVEMRKEEIDLPSMVAEIAERVGTPEDRARIGVEAPVAMPPVPADPERIERVIVNLLTNALKYSPAASPVVLRVAQRGGDALLAVTDRGVGIPAEDIPHLFHRYYRARTAGKREGLGLYITRLIVEAHGGKVWVESEVGRGSTLGFTLPLAPD